MSIISVKYIYRIDDITEDMNWTNFYKCIDIFSKYKVTPLIGIVPQNEDVELMIGNKNKNFWEEMRSLKDGKKVEIGQHGYRHILDSQGESILKSKWGFKRESEFTGKNYDEQLLLLRKGRTVMKENGLETDVFIAPEHTFDFNTLRVLRELGFKYITDGVGLTPYEIEGIKLIPQQFGKPRTFICGLITICLHINKYKEEDFHKLEKHVSENKHNSIKFSEAVNYEESKWLNNVFRYIYLPFKSIRS